MANSWNDISLTIEYTTAINFDSAAATIESALDAVYGAGIPTVTADTDFTIAFPLSVGDSDLLADFTSLTGASSASLTIIQDYFENPLEGINAGTKDCDCQITCNMISDSTGGLKVTLIETSEYLGLDRSLGSTDVVVFNTQTRMVTVNSSDARADIDFDSTWFKLPASTFSVLSEPGSTSVEMEIVYRQRWI